MIPQTTAYTTATAARGTYRRRRCSAGRSSVIVGHDIDTREGEGGLAVIAAEAHVRGPVHLGERELQIVGADLPCRARRSKSHRLPAGTCEHRSEQRPIEHRGHRLRRATCDDDGLAGHDDLGSRDRVAWQNDARGEPANPGETPAAIAFRF